MSFHIYLVYDDDVMIALNVSKFTANRRLSAQSRLRLTRRLLPVPGIDGVGLFRDPGSSLEP